MNFYNNACLCAFNKPVMSKLASYKTLKSVLREREIEKLFLLFSIKPDLQRIKFF